MKNLILRYIILIIYSILISIQSYAQIITTVVGNATLATGYSGDGGQATSAQLNYPQGIAFDSFNNMYIADYGNNVIRKVTTGNIISTFAGNYTLGIGYSGDGGQATSAQLDSPTGITFDASGNMYIVVGKVIRKVTTGGIISTVAGNNSLIVGYSGDGGIATSAQLYSPNDIAFDASGNMYISDFGNNVIRKVDAITNIISTVVGNYALGTGYSGDGGLATSAQLYHPEGIAFDASGNMYIADQYNQVIRKVTTGGIISTVAGNYSLGSGYSGDGAIATSAQLSSPHDIAFDSNDNMYIVDNSNSVIRRVDAITGIITTIAGNYILGATYKGDGGLATAAALKYPSFIAFDSFNNMFIADYGNNVIRKVSASVITTKIQPATTIENELIIYPNPNNGNFELRTNNYELGLIQIRNSLGELIYSNQPIQKSILINLSQLNNGAYFVSSNGTNEPIYQKIIVNK
jgi:sugar lactone lactonase YvrE